MPLIYEIKVLNFHIHFNVSLASSAKEICETYNFLYGVSIGNSQIGSVKLDNPVSTIEEQEYFKALAEVWRKISLIEERLNLVLVPQEKGVVNIETYLVELLYQSLVNKQPIKKNWDINSVEVDKSAVNIGSLNRLQGGAYFLALMTMRK